MMDCDILVSSNSNYTITFTFKLKTFGNGMNTLIPVTDLIVILLIYEDSFNN